MTAALPPLDEGLLARRLLTDAGGAYSRIQRMDSVGSTNQWLTQALTAEATEQRGTAWPHLSVLTAEEQTSGRGRLGRAWSSPKGASLSSSIVLRPQLDPAHLGWLSMLAGRALVDTLRQDCGLDAEGQRAILKWPNDVQVTQAEGPAKKISGILAAAVSPASSATAAPSVAPGSSAIPPGSVSTGARAAVTSAGSTGPRRTGPGAVVLGVGINVLLTPEQLPIENSTSVLIELRRRAAQGPRGPQGAGLEASSAQSGSLELGSSELGPLRTELLCSFLERFAALLHCVESAAERDPETVPQLLIAQVSEVLATLGQQVRVELPDGSAQRGVAVGLTPQGALQVEVTDRRAAPELEWTPVMPALAVFSAGDVTHLRPTP